MDTTSTQASNDPSAPKPPSDPVPWLLAGGGFALVALVAGAALRKIEQHEAKMNNMSDTSTSKLRQAVAEEWTRAALEHGVSPSDQPIFLDDLVLRSWAINHKHLPDYDTAKLDPDSHTALMIQGPYGPLRPEVHDLPSVWAAMRTLANRLRDKHNFDVNYYRGYWVIGSR
jgi:hypothetical protein